MNIELQSKKKDYFSSVDLAEQASDVIGNAAVFDLVKLLQSECEGGSLIKCLEQGDNSVLKLFSNDDELVEEWTTKFKSILNNEKFTSHKLAKQFISLWGQINTTC